MAEPVKRFAFTNSKLTNLPLPHKGRRVSYTDEKSPGLELIHKSSGVKTFFTNAWLASKNGKVRILIGRFPDISIKAARRQNVKNKELVASGIDPNDSKREKRNELTLQELFDKCLERHFKPHNKSWAEYEAIYRRYLMRWSGRLVSSLGADLIESHHANVGKEHGEYSANRMLQLLSSLYSWAVKKGYAVENPAKGVDRFKEKSRERFLEAHELPAFFKSLAEEANDTIRDYILISLLTGARRANVLAMRWEEISFEAGIWTIPETKNGTSQRIPLTKEALHILQARKDTGSQFVFPGPGKTGHLVEPKAAWKRILERAKLKHLRIHDLRRSLGSWRRERACR